MHGVKSTKNKTKNTNTSEAPHDLHRYTVYEAVILFGVKSKSLAQATSGKQMQLSCHVDYWFDGSKATLQLTEEVTALAKHTETQTLKMQVQVSICT